LTVLETGPRAGSPLHTGETPAGRDVSDLLRLLGSGATGSILLALREGPLRTRDLATRVPGFAPRTVSRYVGRLIEIGALSREEMPGIPSRVIHRLTQPDGVELARLVDTYAQTALDVLPSGTVVPHSWGSLALLADLWESGMFHALTGKPRTATELARVEHGLSFHQVARRITLLLIDGLIQEVDDGQKRRRYELAKQARRASALIAGLGIWRERHVVGGETSGLTVAEAGDLLRSALPLVMLPNHCHKVLKFTVESASGVGDGGSEVIWAKVEADGAVAHFSDLDDRVDGWGQAGAGGWSETFAHGLSSQVRVAGTDSLVTTCFDQMYEALWGRSIACPSENGRTLQVSSENREHPEISALRNERWGNGTDAV